MYTLKKSLGQHFLKDETVCKRIIAVLEETPPDNLLEVGPGGGALTKYLLEIPDIDFKAVELDHEKVVYLTERYPVLAHKIIEASILEIRPPFPGQFTLIGNFPYNISTQIMFLVLDWREQVERVIGMFQKEVAVRIASGPGNKDYGILSVMLQAYFKVEYLFDVDEDSFNPPPKVKSGVISLQNMGKSIWSQGLPETAHTRKSRLRTAQKAIAQSAQSFVSRIGTQRSNIYQASRTVIR